MTILDVPQRSQEWFAARLGRLCSSRAADMLATLKSGGEAASRRDLRVQLALERITGLSQESGYINGDMQRGIDKEPDAIAAYEAHRGELVQPVGYCLHDSLMAGCSPDGFVGDDGLVEVKCPRSATHLGYLRDWKVPKDYLPQLTHALWITGRSWIDFCSFDDRFPAPLQLFCVRHRRNDVEIKSYELAATLFLSEVERECEAVQALAQQVTA
jgi:YqaJ-like viral recombinase domain